MRQIIKKKKKDKIQDKTNWGKKKDKKWDN